MKRLILALLVAIAGDAYCCGNDYECDVGAKCIKSGSSLYGVCVGGYNSGSGAPKDSGPKEYGTSKAGNSCSNKYECGIGGECLKSGNAIYGTCTK